MHFEGIAVSYGAGHVRVFGSVARGTEHRGSDVDLLMDLPDAMGLFALGRLRRDLEDLNSEPDLPWAEIARMRDQLAHRYFDTTHAIVSSTVVHDLPILRPAIGRLLDVAGED